MPTNPAARMRHPRKIERVGWNEHTVRFTYHLMSGNPRFGSPPRPAIGAERKKPRLGDAPFDRRLRQCQVSPAGLLMRVTVFACMFF